MQQLENVLRREGLAGDGLKFAVALGSRRRPGSKDDFGDVLSLEVVKKFF